MNEMVNARLTSAVVKKQGPNQSDHKPQGPACDHFDLSTEFCNTLAAFSSA
jgi:hypothetical protein